MTQNIQQMSLWDQVACRVYTPMAILFPTEPTAKPSEIKFHLQCALHRLGQAYPNLAGRLILANDKKVHLVTSSSTYIELEVMTDDFGLSYAALREQGFPVKPFIKPEYNLPGGLEVGSPVRVFRVRILFIDGGFVMFVYLHHAFADGNCRNVVLQLLANATHLDDPIPNLPSSSRTLDLPYNQVQYQKDWKTLLEACPEYTLLPNPTGPTQPIFPAQDAEFGLTDNTGLVFVIDSGRLDVICKLAKDFKLSKYMALAAITWVHTVRARIETLPADYTAYFANKKPTLINAHHWANPRKGLFKGNASLGEYFGNAIAMPLTIHHGTVDSLVEACSWHDHLTQGRVPEALLQVAKSVTDTNLGVDEDFVLRRTALFANMLDLRFLGLNQDPWDPYCVGFNTHQSVGAKAGFVFPGVPRDGNTGRTVPDAIRRVQGQFSPLTHGLILPARPGLAPGETELMITLPHAAMGFLLEDQAFMSLVKRVIG